MAMFLQAMHCRFNIDHARGRFGHWFGRSHGPARKWTVDDEREAVRCAVCRRWVLADVFEFWDAHRGGPYILLKVIPEPLHAGEDVPRARVVAGSD